MWRVKATYREECASGSRLPGAVLERHYEGSTRDKPIADAAPYPLPQDSELLDDLGFLGYELADARHTRPTRKPKGGELTADQKEHNRQVARRRVLIEHILKRPREHRSNQLEERALLGPAWKEHDLIFSTEVGTPITPRNLSRYF